VIAYVSSFLWFINSILELSPSIYIEMGCSWFNTEINKRKTSINKYVEGLVPAIASEDYLKEIRNKRKRKAKQYEGLETVNNSRTRIVLYFQQPSLQGIPLGIFLCYWKVVWECSGLDQMAVD
jgi:hypothetical protein